MDDGRIAELTAEVLEDLRAPRSPQAAAAPSALEARVAALEAALRALRPSPPAPLPVAVAAHPSLQLLGPSAGGDRCVLEPDKPCVGSGQCRTFGH